MSISTWINYYLIWGLFIERKICQKLPFANALSPYIEEEKKMVAYWQACDLQATFNSYSLNKSDGETHRRSASITLPGLSVETSIQWRAGLGEEFHEEFQVELHLSAWEGSCAVSEMIFMEFSNVYCTRFGSVKNIIQNDSVLPHAWLAFRQTEEGRCTRWPLKVPRSQCSSVIA